MNISDSDTHYSLSFHILFFWFFSPSRKAVSHSSHNRNSHISYIFYRRPRYDRKKPNKSTTNCTTLYANMCLSDYRSHQHKDIVRYSLFIWWNITYRYALSTVWVPFIPYYDIPVPSPGNDFLVCPCFQCCEFFRLSSWTHLRFCIDIFYYPRRTCYKALYSR